MKFLTATMLLFFIGYCTGKLNPVKNCGKSMAPQGRIVGGKQASHGAYPWMVSLQELKVNGKFQHICGASILNENWTLTAAHCFETPLKKSDYQVIVGLHSILEPNASNTARIHKISEVIIHKDYKEAGYFNDIALMKMDTPIDFKGSKGYVNAICVPTGVTNPSGDATVIGWGRMKSGGPMVDKLREVTIPIVPWKQCKDIYGDPHSEFEKVQITPFMLCAGGNGKDTCQNDSGGPLFQVDKDGVATLLGTVASGGDCGYKHYPGIYMKVSSFRSWIDKHVT